MILVTGATGFLGKELLKNLKGKIRVLSRNEGKLIELKNEFPNIEIITGCISDEMICKHALRGVDKVYHLAAFKHVGQAEKQPYQCTTVNLVGTINLLKYFRGTSFIAISTDKAAQVNGVYGATKYLMEEVIREFEYMNPHINYRIVRYGNVLYSTGSVLCKWKEAIINGKDIIITEPNATRYFWTVKEAIDLIFECEKHAKDCTPYCPEMKSMKVEDLLDAMIEKYAGENTVFIKTIGLQQGENMHEKITKNGLSSEDAPKFTIEEIKKLI